jgi:hypothetical protein
VGNRNKKVPTKQTFAEIQAELKKPREQPHESSQRKYPGWHFRSMDIDGPWGFCPTKHDDSDAQILAYDEHCETLEYIRGKLSEFEVRYWSEILGKHSHAVSLEGLSPEARLRLEEIGQFDVEELVSLHFSSTGRLWGIRDNEYFKILWWDPNHQVCTSDLKHT